MKCMRYFKDSMLKLLLLGIIIPALIVPRTTMAADVTLAWDANSETDLAGYKIYYGSVSQSYTNVVDVGNVITYTVQNLLPFKYYFAATAYNLSNLESGYSNEVSNTVNTIQIMSTAAAINWYGVVLLTTTNINASAILRYHKVEDNYQTYTIIATLASNMKTQHRAILDLPTGSPAYYAYTWIVTDAQGNMATISSTFQTH
jgi:hypothetical protein